ncbi:MAG: SDR family NAD(P)-dependent oxidoreductase [Planctomycetota bacterium]
MTGASSGIGRALALELVRRGLPELVVTARREALLVELADELRALGGRVHTEVLDVTDPERVFACVRRWDQELGGFDLVVANAGIGAARAVQEQTWEDIDSVLAVNVQGAIATLFAALEPMLRRNTGTLVGISSVASQRGLPQSGAYSASKAALSTWLETIGLDLHATGLSVVDVRPGFVLTAMTASAEFPKPFEISVEAAARITVDGIERGRAVVSFPRPMAGIMWLARRLPDTVWRFVARRVR